MLARHKIPPGRSLNGARAKAQALHIPFRHSIRSTAIKFGLAYTSVRKIAVEIGLVD